MISNMKAYYVFVLVISSFWYFSCSVENMSLDDSSLIPGDSIDINHEPNEENENTDSLEYEMSIPTDGYPLPTLYIRNGMANVFNKLKSESEVTIAYLGGSITNHEGYRKYNQEWFESEYPNTKINFINAGIGGTGAELGVFRIDDDVLKYNPDLVFVEFAVNDGSTDSLRLSNSIEGIIRKIKRRNSSTDICFLYTINEPMVGGMKLGQLYCSVKIIDRVAEHYNLPSVNFGVEVVKLLMHGRLVFKAPAGTVFEDKIVFTNDGTHPTFDQGHVLYSDILSKSLKEIRYTTDISTLFPEPLYDTNYEYALMLSPSELTKTGSWNTIDTSHKLYKLCESRYPDLIWTSDEVSSIEFDFTGNFFGVYDITGPGACSYNIVIDNDIQTVVQRFDSYCYYYRSHFSFVYLSSLSFSKHKVKLSLSPMDYDKKHDIVSNRYSDKITEDIENDFKSNNIYIGRIMVCDKEKYIQRYLRN